MSITFKKLKDKINWKSIVKFKLKIDKTPGHGPWGDCHLYIGDKSEDGYGLIQLWDLVQHKRIMITAHILIYILVYNKIPKGKELSHKCHVRNCCNLKHLKAESHRKNMLRSAKAKRFASGIRHGTKTHPRSFGGEHSGRHKLKNKLVREIRLAAILDTKWGYQGRIAKKFKVNKK